jgi:hypothetical protein
MARGMRQRDFSPVRNLAFATALAVLAFCGMTAVHGQSGTVAFSSNDQSVTPSPYDQQAAGDAERVYRHAFYARTQAGDVAKGLAKFSRRQVAASAAPTAPGGGIANSVQNPGDLTFQGGQTVEFAVSHAIYVNPGGTCATIASCWGNPEGFLGDLAKSDFIHVVDQYTGLTADRRYTVSGSRAVVKGTLAANPLSETNLLSILHAVASKTGLTGYSHIYHLFLAPGIDTCFDAPFNNQCYSPDNSATFAFCAYHGSVDFLDIGHVLFTVEPFQDVSGCTAPAAGSPNGQMFDATNDTLSHELFETITDPDGDAYWNRSSFGLFGEEIGDECLFVDANLAIAEPTFRINHKLYRVQTEYSNSRHACAIEP